jgi:hypothetical protein
MRLRVRHADGVATLGDISSDQTILVLKQKIISAIGLSSTQTIQSIKKKQIVSCCFNIEKYAHKTNNSFRRIPTKNYFR